MTFAAVILVCAAAVTPAPADCRRDTAIDVLVLDDLDRTPIACLMHGEAYIAQTGLVAEGFFLKVTCERRA